MIPTIYFDLATHVNFSLPFDEVIKTVNKFSIYLQDFNDFGLPFKAIQFTTVQDFSLPLNAITVVN